jgi:hypothetical protein
LHIRRKACKDNEIEQWYHLRAKVSTSLILVMKNRVHGEFSLKVRATRRLDSPINHSADRECRLFSAPSPSLLFQSKSIRCPIDAHGLWHVVRFSICILEIRVNERLAYKLKIYSITGDCPALRMILSFIGHGGYFCCWFCYLRGEHINGKRQYKYEEPTVARSADAYFDESCLAEQSKTNVFGHIGVSVIQSVLDVRLPDAIIADYLHVALLGHAKALIINLYHSVKPADRQQLDKQFIEQPFPHFFNRKMKPIGNFAFVKATEIRNILFYGLLPNFQSLLSIEKCSHVALYVCFIRLLHGESAFGHETSKTAAELFREFYRDHDDHYDGLQNFVLHLHVHLTAIYEKHGSLSNIGCFAQEDLIGKIGSSHHGTRYYGELITYYYNIDYCLHQKPSEQAATKTLHDPVTSFSDQCEFLHAQVCDCDQPRQCIIIYKRFNDSNGHTFHSMMYSRRGRSISYFTEYRAINKSRRYGAIVLFYSTNNGTKSFALIDRYRPKRAFSDHFKKSKYYSRLKAPLDSLFFVLENSSTSRDIIRTDFIVKHCIVFQQDDCKIVTPVSTYDEHD